MRAGTPIGTVWVLAHGEERKFDAEDARLLSSLSRFAATAVHALAQARDARRAAEALRESEGRHRFLAGLAAATQPLADPGDVMAVTARRLAEHLGVDRCAYAEVEDERIFVITGDYTAGVRSIVGRWPVADFGPEVLRLMLANEPYVIDDVDVDPRAGDNLTAYRATQIQAVICVPLHKSGRFTAAMAVHQKVPRRWSAAEVGLVRLVVGRCWEAIERARAARGVRERDERLDYAVRLSGLGFWYCDLPFDDLIWDDRVKEHFWLPWDARVTIRTFYERLAGQRAGGDHGGGAADHRGAPDDDPDDRRGRRVTGGQHRVGIREVQWLATPPGYAHRKLRPCGSLPYKPPRAAHPG